MKTLHTSDRDLRNYLKDIIKIPALLKRLDKIELIELLEYIQRLKEDMSLDLVRTIPLLYNYSTEKEFNTLFEHLKKNTSFGQLYYYDVTFVETLIKKELKLLPFKKEIEPLSTVSKNDKTQHLDIFTSGGFELFEYLNKHFKHSSKMTKYSEILFFLSASNEKYIYCTKEKFRIFINDNYIKLSRLYDTSLEDTNINNELSNLKDNYFKQKNNS